MPRSSASVSTTADLNRRSTPERAALRRIGGDPRRALAVLAAAFALIAVSGCGSSSSSSSTESTAASTASPETSTPGATTTTPSGTQSTPTEGGSSTTTPSGTSASPDNSIQTYGSAAGGAEKAAVLSATHSFFHALAAPNYASVCSQLASSNRKELQQYLKLGHSKAHSCATLLPTLLQNIGPTASKAAKGTFTAVRIQGPRAFVLFRPKGGPPSYFLMLKEGGTWKPTSLAPGVPLNP
jgi:hypothetical protein